MSLVPGKSSTPSMSATPLPSSIASSSSTTTSPAITSKCVCSIARITKSSTQNWLGANLIGELCLTEVLLTVLHDKQNGLPEDGKQLHKVMMNFKSKCQNKLGKIIKKHQWELICPKSGVSNSKDWDITLLKVVIQYNVLNSSPPVKGWEKDISPTDHSLAADVCRVKDIRNELKHSTIKTFSVQTHYDDVIRRIEAILKRVNYQRMQLFEDLKSGFFELHTSLAVTLLQDKLSDIYKEMDILQKQGAENTLDILDLKHDVRVHIADDKKQNEKLEDLTDDVNDMKNYVEQFKKDEEETRQQVEALESELIRVNKKLFGEMSQIKSRIEKLEETCQKQSRLLE